MSESFIRPKEAAKQAGLSVSHMYRLISQDEFPRPIRLSERISAFLKTEIDQWISKQIETARSEETE